MSTVDEILKGVELGVFLPESYVSILASEVVKLRKDLSAALWASENAFKGTNQWGQVS